MGAIFSDPWVAWVSLAVVLVVIEIFTLGYLAIGFAISALIMAILSFLGVSPGMWGIAIWVLIGTAFWISLAWLNPIGRRKEPDVNDFDPFDSLSEDERTASSMWSEPSTSYDTDSRLHEQKTRPPKKDDVRP